MNKDEFKKLMIDFMEFMEVNEDVPEEVGCENMSLDIFPGRMDSFDIVVKPTYKKRDFINAIFEIGKSMYKPSSGFFEKEYFDSLFEGVSEKLVESFNVPYFSVRKQGQRIAIAAPVYIQNAPIKIGKELGVIPDIFIEVSGPMSTVLVIDCEKEWLRKEYLKIGEDEWLL